MPEFSILILARNEAKNLQALLPQILAVFKEAQLSFEVIIVDARSMDNTREIGEGFGARVHVQKEPGYGAAFCEGISLCGGDWLITLDADLSHPPPFLKALIAHKGEADLLIGSRYVAGGSARMERYREFLSRLLSAFCRLVLAMRINDMSSGYRMYRVQTLRSLRLEARNFDVLIEVLVRLVARGAVVKELPFHYQPRVFGKSNVKLFRFALSYLSTIFRMRRLLRGLR